MKLLSSENVVQFLAEKHLLPHGSNGGNTSVAIPTRATLNSNFIVSIEGIEALIVKQPRSLLNDALIREAQFHAWLKSRDDYNSLRRYVPEFVFFDSGNQVLVAKYLIDYEDLEHYHQRIARYSRRIARNIAELIATFHFDSYDNPDRYVKLRNSIGSKPFYPFGIYVTPEQLSYLPLEGKQLLQLIQEDDEFVTSIDRAQRSWVSSCLIHKDLKMNNILKPVRFNNLSDSNLILTDWELCEWGDPAWDVASIIGSYLQCWLSSLKASADSPIDVWFTKATLPLQKVKPAIDVFWCHYNSICGPMLKQRPEFPTVTMQYTGLFLVEKARSVLQWLGCLTAKSLAYLRVANNLITEPEIAAALLLGVDSHGKLNGNRV